MPILRALVGYLSGTWRVTCGVCPIAARNVTTTAPARSSKTGRSIPWRSQASMTRFVPRPESVANENMIGEQPGCPAIAIGEWMYAYPFSMGPSSETNYFCCLILRGSLIATWKEAVEFMNSLPKALKEVVHLGKDPLGWHTTDSTDYDLVILKTVRHVFGICEIARIVGMRDNGGKEIAVPGLHHHFARYEAMIM
jgi:hypothetical protein